MATSTFNYPCLLLFHSTSGLHQDNLPSRSSTTDEGSTQLSSSDSSAKLPSIDEKSVTSGATFSSGATFPMDEKESLRPDDSASLRAVKEEDTLSISGSRLGSENGDTTFKEQLQELPVMGPLPDRGMPAVLFTPMPSTSDEAAYDTTPVAGIVQPMVSPIPSSSPTGFPPRSLNADPKLLDALESPRDRLFVLKLEQDLIDFIKDSKEERLDLPACNAFYRMLAHRLADYYLLSHMVDDNMSAVRITRTNYCRLPVPLSGISTTPKVSKTPPLTVPTKKIMRRLGDCATSNNTSTNSEGPSMSTSEIGESGSDGGHASDSKSKTQLTREEREAKYEEARKRIFGDSEQNESENIENAKENDPSRSSSASGKKKIGKKSRNYNDDGFEARSQYNAYYTPQFDGGLSEPQYYAPFSGMVQNSQYPVGANIPQVNYTGCAPMIQQDSGMPYSWPSQSFQSNSPIGIQGFSPMIPSEYDVSGDLQRGMRSCQHPISQSVSVKLPPPPVSSYAEPFRTSPQISYQNAFSAHPYGQPIYPDRPLSACELNGQPGQYGFGHVTVPNYQNDKFNRNQCPMPGNFSRQPMNSQIQVFVPGSQPGPPPVQSPMQPPMPGISMPNYPVAPVFMPNQSQTPGSRPDQRSHLPSLPLPPPIFNYAPNASTHQPYRKPNSPRGPNTPGKMPCPQSLAHPLPPLVSSAKPGGNSTLQHSSIAKWGTPAHLPPKPPPPASMQSRGLPGLGLGVGAGNRVGTGYGTSFNGVMNGSGEGFQGGGRRK